MTDLTVISPPAGEALSLAEAKDFLRIGHEGEDSLVTGLIESARARLEAESGLALVARTLKQTWREWPAEMGGRGAPLRPGPVRGVVSVARVTSAGSEDLTAHFALDCGRLVLRPASRLPPVRYGVEQIEVVFEAGFGAPEAVPEDLRLCLKRLVQDAYERGSERGRLPQDVSAMLARRRGARL
jgi:uncharacterized phiE125 gp8 family phage protein